MKISAIMDPIIQSFNNSSKRQVMDAFPTALAALNMSLYGRHNRLGLISIKEKNNPILYAHIIGHSNGTTDVSIAPGMHCLKDRDNAERPESTIQSIMKELVNIIGKKHDGLPWRTFC